MIRRLSFFVFSTLSMFLNAQATSDSKKLPPEAIRPCARCVEAREYNSKHPNPYFYYEDYVEAKEEKNTPQKETPPK